MKKIRPILICLSLAALTVQAVVGQTARRSRHSIPPRIHARIIQLEDERNLNDGELTALLKHQTPEVRERAALAVGRIGDPHGTEPLIEKLQKDGDARVRAMAAFGLGEIEDARAAQALLDAANTPKENLNVRARAVEALGKIGSVRSNAEKLGQSTLDSIHKSLINQLPSADSEPPADAKLLASLTVTALMRLQNAASVEPLTQQLKSKDTDIRAQAANALARLRKPIGIAVPALIEALNDPDVDVRANAARALGSSKDARSVEPLLKTLNDTEERAQVSAVRALAAIGDRRAVEGLIELAKRSDPKATIHRQRPPRFNTFLECVVALGALKDERALPFLAQSRAAYAQTGIPEIEVAIAKFGFAKFQEMTPDFFNQDDSCHDWKRASAAMQTVSEWLPTKEGGVWERIFYELFYGKLSHVKSPTCDRRSLPEMLRVINKLTLNFLNEPSFTQLFRSKEGAGGNWQPDLYLSFFPQQLKEKDVVVRSTTATIMAGQPREHSLTPLIEALSVSRKDSANDARLAILTAISKHNKPEAVDAIKSALDDSDHLVRRHAVDLLKQIGAGDFSDRIGIVRTGHDKLFYQRVVARTDKKVTATIFTDKGQIKLELFPQEAPITVDSFVTLARKGFFNNLAFHRVVPNFVIQGGDPRGDGEGGPGYQIRCEVNTRLYRRGSVGMALSGKDTGGSQFFITHAPQPHLDGGYTVFGQVLSGMEVVDRIARGDLIRKIVINEGK